MEGGWTTALHRLYPWPAGGCQARPRPKDYIFMAWCTAPTSSVYLCCKVRRVASSSWVNITGNILENPPLLCSSCHKSQTESPSSLGSHTADLITYWLVRSRHLCRSNPGGSILRCHRMRTCLSADAVVSPSALTRVLELKSLHSDLYHFRRATNENRV